MAQEAGGGPQQRRDCGFCRKGASSGLAGPNRFSRVWAGQGWSAGHLAPGPGVSRAGRRRPGLQEPDKRRWTAGGNVGWVGLCIGRCRNGSCALSPGVRLLGLHGAKVPKPPKTQKTKRGMNSFLSLLAFSPTSSPSASPKPARSLQRRHHEDSSELGG